MVEKAVQGLTADVAELKQEATTTAAETELKINNLVGKVGGRDASTRSRSP